MFEVEALCYSTEKGKSVLRGKKSFKKGGLFILFDGYLNKQDSQITDLEIITKNLIEKSMALSTFESYQSFINKAKLSNFEIIHEENLSKFILPTMYRFENLASKFFKHPYIARILSLFLPQELAYNSVAGYLMPNAIKSNLLCYMLTVMKNIKNGPLTLTKNSRS